MVMFSFVTVLMFDDPLMVLTIVSMATCAAADASVSDCTLPAMRRLMLPKRMADTTSRVSTTSITSATTRVMPCWRLRGLTTTSWRWD